MLFIVFNSSRIKIRVSNPIFNILIWVQFNPNLLQSIPTHNKRKPRALTWHGMLPTRSTSTTAILSKRDMVGTVGDASDGAGSGLSRAVNQTGWKGFVRDRMQPPSPEHVGSALVSYDTIRTPMRWCRGCRWRF